MLILRDVIAGNKRFCELERSLAGISTRTLANKLKKLEAEGLVRKTSRGAYSASAKAKGLRAVEQAMFKYGSKYL